MQIIIHRGQNQIGGSIIELRTARTRIVLDIGVNLDENAQAETPAVPGLFDREGTYNGVFISHYHADHIGLLDKLAKDIPVYMGERAYRIFQASKAYRHLEVNIAPHFIHHRESLQIGDMEITPYACDHSAYDSYMFLIRHGGKTVLYTGDFRANGRMDYADLLRELPEADALIIEGTTLSREAAVDNIPEETLEDIAVRELKQHSGPAFVMMSAMNLDRLVTMHRAARRTGRVLLEDLYTAQIAAAAGPGLPCPDRANSVRVFVTDGNPARYQQLNAFGDAKIGRKAIAGETYILCVRPSMRNYLKKLRDLQSFADGVLFYGMWKGYQEKEDMAEFLQWMRDQGVKVHTLHTSGHADARTIDRLIEDIRPKILLPVHTENPAWFDRYRDSMRVVCNTNTVEL